MSCIKTTFNYILESASEKKTAVGAKLPFTSLNKSSAKRRVSVVVLHDSRQRSFTVNPVTEVRTGIKPSKYLLSCSCGQYADQYRKTREGRLMSACRLCLAVLQRLRDVCHDNEIHYA